MKGDYGEAGAGARGARMENTVESAFAFEWR